jgi:hypothetical protein
MYITHHCELCDTNHVQLGKWVRNLRGNKKIEKYERKRRGKEQIREAKKGKKEYIIKKISGVFVS